jgi:hypothetical protein
MASGIERRDTRTHSVSHRSPHRRAGRREIAAFPQGETQHGEQEESDMEHNRTKHPSHVRLKGTLATLVVTGALLFSGAAPSSAEQIDPIPQPTGKTWKGNIYNATPYFPYVQVFDVRDPKKEADLSDPKLGWYFVLPFAPWEVDCKYWHSSMGWMYRGTHIQGIDDSGGPYNGYYETGYLATILDGGLKVDDVDEICFPGGDKPAG